MDSTNQQIRQPVEQKNIKDRRKSPRFDASAISSLKVVHQVGGPEVKLINISRGGALIESPMRVAPGSNLTLRLVTAETVYLLYGHVLRCYVSAIGQTFQYQCSIIFDEDFTLLPPG